MHVLRCCVLAFLLLFSAPSLARGDPDWLYRGSDIPRDTAWTFGTLDNGVRYAVRRNKLPEGQVAIRVRVDAGSFHEEDRERGWAHLIEHLAFRGTKSFADHAARDAWQKLGAGFGSDTNATTQPTQTVYQLDLPKNDRSSLDQSLWMLAEMVDSALLDPAAIEAEKKIVLAEKGRRSELTNRVMETSRPLFYAGLRIADRDTIGTEATLNVADAKGLRAFYERWYRPERTTVVMVGDADPALMEELIASRFGSWKGTGTPPAEPDYGQIQPLDGRTAALSYPGVPYAASVMWLRPYKLPSNTKAEERVDLARMLGTRILNRRLEAKARSGASYVSAGVGVGLDRNVADMTQLSVTARNGQWRQAIAESFSIIADAQRAPPSEAEIRRELQNLRTSALSAIESESTIRSPARAQQLVNAIDSNSIVAAAPTNLALVDEFAPQMTPDVVLNGLKTMFSGSGPRLMLVSPDAVDVAAVNAALTSAEKAEPATRMADREVSFDDLPVLGTPGKEVSRERIGDLGATIVRFANGSTLVFKQTDFEKGLVQLQLRFGQGVTGLPSDRTHYLWLSGAVGYAGIGNLDLDAMERLLTGRRMALNFSVAEDAFVLMGATNGTDLADQLRLLAAKLAAPRWDAPMFERVRASALESYDLSFASAAARAGREAGAVMRPGDRRWAPIEKAQVAAASPEAFRDFFTPILAEGPIEAIIVGDVDLETAVAAMAKTIGALPARAPARIAQGALDVAPPQPNPVPKTFTHRGDPDQAYAMIGWTTFGGTDRMAERRALSVAAELFRMRLFERLREEEGVTYTPSASASASDRLKNWGIFYAASELKPESVTTFFRIAREIVRDMAAKPAAVDEFARALNPILSSNERRLKTNAYWLTEMENWSRDPSRMERTRTFLSAYRNLTAEDVRTAVARHVADAGDWSMVVLPAKAAGGGN